MAEENKNNEEPKTIGERQNTRIKRLKEKCKGSLKFSFIFFTAIHITKIVLAAVYYEKCPAEPSIPKYLLAMGILGVATKLTTLFKDCLIKYTKVSPILSFIMTAELALFICASYYIYREYEPDYEHQFSPRYCNKTLYLFSFIYITITYCLILFFVFVIGCFVLGLILLDKYGPKEKQPDAENTTEVPPEHRKTERK